MKPDQLLEKLQEGSSDKVRKTLNVIYSVCKNQLDNGIYDFSIATIARLGSQEGVPKAQSIRNKSGEKYRALIECFAQNNRRFSTAKRPESWIEEIDNAKHRLLVQMMASELSALKQKVNEIIPPERVIHVYDRSEPVEHVEKFNSVERRSLEYILSNSFLRRWHLSETEFGELVDDQGKVVFKPGTIDALRKALRYL
jgi:hypothetical protein